MAGVIDVDHAIEVGWHVVILPAPLEKDVPFTVSQLALIGEPVADDVG